MFRTITITISTLLLVAALIGSAGVETPAAAVAAKTYTVGFISEPCYISNTPEGYVEGLIAEIWIEIAKRAGVNYTFREFKDAAGLREKLISGEVDFFLNGIKRTSKNADIAVFSQVFHVSNLSILLIKVWNLRLIENFKAVSVVWSGVVMQIFAMFMLVAFIYANILWFLEKTPGAVKSYKKGIFDAMWCVVAMETTIGFGDIVPRKLLARMFSVVVWFTGLLLITLISAEIISEFSTNKILYTIRTFSDLKNNTVAVPNDLSIINDMKAIGAKPVVVSNYKDIYDILKKGKADAAVLNSLPAIELAKQAYGLAPNTIDSTTHEVQWQAGMSTKTFDKRLFDEINNIILDMRYDGSISAMHDKWLH
ncbi:transporter substrate-binding domain-containing protein [Candidatus Magnetominusculus xianensis]|uniref:Extracellular solute-binding protein n=1 Tax=Candidatus Magnetominusculus xianensis TaxID=1748249 RepID=A0ABR5SIY1_9BACT|nr:transporter substrate-binding domain-containing protein [Candidatus Magnetominusculus xianensis]KWT92933.1 extracellular solute-binding protein [Candidatus Magnetominusculus xianensis]MBF0402937.1 transporter substrate-binding domain-containing protein [Nitrospirota bacterium]